MRSEREMVLGRNPGPSNQHAEKLTDAASDGSRVPEYRVAWSREGWKKPRERTFWQENAAMALIRALRRNHPRWPTLVTLRLDGWIDGAWGALSIHTSSTDSPARATNDHPLADELALHRARRTSTWPGGAS